MKCFWLFLLMAYLDSAVGADDWASLRSELATAQAGKDLAGVHKAWKKMIEDPGNDAGTEEEETLFVQPNEDAKLLDPADYKAAFMPVLQALSDEPPWWKSAKSPTDAAGALRQPASVLLGCAAALEAGCARPDALESEARAAGDYLCRAQAEAGRGCFPLPAWREKRGKLGALSAQLLATAEKLGRLKEVEVKGWIVDDLGEGDLQLDNDLCATALLRAGRVLNEGKYLSAARAAGDWTMKQPTVPDCTINSHSVHLLAELFVATNEPLYLTAAKEKARLGIYPGQIQSGPNQGRWADPHSARLVQHYAIIRGLASLLAVIPEGDADSVPLAQCLRLALNARNAEILEKGAAHPDITSEVFIQLLSAKGPLEKISRETKSPEAASLTFRFAVDERARSHATVSPGTWGSYLYFLVNSGEK